MPLVEKYSLSIHSISTLNISLIHWPFSDIMKQTLFSYFASTYLMRLCRPSSRSKLMFLAVLLAVPAFPQAEHPVTGRRIAPVMGTSGADWLDRSEREQEEEPEKAIEALKLKPGMKVGDVGAGTGYYSLRIAKRVSPGGKVYAVDIQPEMLERLRTNAATQGVTNVETVLGTDSDPKLPAGQLDLVVLIDVYHEFSRPQRMLQRIRDSLKPDGHLVLLEYRKEDPSVPIRPEHKMSVSEVKAEVQPEGFIFEKSVETMPWQHVIFFRRAISN
jgi:ubiquinone/menaquinone biosynthesis C-methylase UbiE